MKKKEPQIIEEVVVEEVKPKIGKLEIVYNNEELNKLRDKVNEIIDNL